MKIQRVMIWVFGVLVPFGAAAVKVSARADLGAGIYRDLKPTQPLVLDSGSYTFIGLEMRGIAPPPGRGRGPMFLDARKARSLTLVNCTFKGSGKGIGVFIGGHATISNCKFTQMKTGILASIPAGLTPLLNITGNTFRDLHTSISLNRLGEETATVDFTLKCNTFENTPQTGSNPITRKGLVIGEGVQLRAPNNLTGTNFLTDQIGGAAGFNANGTAYPNANVWPTAQEDRGVRPMIGPIEQDLHSSSVGWPNSPNWIAIDNQTGNQINYVRYNNEFVGWGSAISGLIDFPYPAQSGLKIATAGDGVAPGTIGYDFACGNFTDPQIVLFPARIAVVGADVTATKSALILDEAILNDAVPNPSREETRIGIYIPAKSELAVLQILETGTGKVLQTIRVTERGKLEVLLDTRTAPTAVYNYRLLVDGYPVGVKKLVVQH